MAFDHKKAKIGRRADMRYSRTQRIAQVRAESVRPLEMVEKRKRNRRRGLIRRLIAFSVLFGVVAALMLTTLFSQAGRLDAASQQKNQLEKKLTESKKESGQLQKQINLLHDKEYIGEIARRDLLLSGDGEIIFEVPGGKED